MQNQKIIIAGGTGFIGRSMAEFFSSDNNVVILTRNVAENNNSFKKFEINKPNISLRHWNGKDGGDWEGEIDGADLVINLAGKSVNCRYTNKNKKEIFDSRTRSTKAIGLAIQKAIHPPKLWINAASATIYRHTMDRPQDEFSGEYHNDFSVQVCKLWEKTFFDVSTPYTRKVVLRNAITLGAGGVMIPYLNLCKFGLGGKQGDGKQMYSWVHIDDVCRLVYWLWDNAAAEGIYNVSSPNPVTNEVFMKTVREVTGHRFGLPAAKWMLQIGALLLGTETELLLKSRWVLPTRLQESGFQFKYPQLKNAVQQIVDQIPRKQYHLF